MVRWIVTVAGFCVGLIAGFGLGAYGALVAAIADDDAELELEAPGVRNLRRDLDDALSGIDTQLENVRARVDALEILSR